MNKRFSRLATPYFVWLYIFALVPCIFMVFLLFVDNEGLDFSNLKFTLDNFNQLSEPATLKAFLDSLLLAFLATLFSIILGYLVAYKLFRSNFKNKFLILIILVLPMWSNLLLRTEALSNILEPNNIIISLINKIFNTDIVGVDFRADTFGVKLTIVLGLVVTYVPFMIMPIYNSLEKIDPSIEEAALDLGLTNFKKFWKIILPMSSKGIVTGSIMVFLPCLSGFAIPEILGKGNFTMIGTIIEQNFRNMNYNIGSLLAVIILFFILIAISIVNKVDKEGETLL